MSKCECAVIRPVADGDVAVVREVFDGLGPGSRYQRFLGAKPELSERELESLSAVDHEDHEALVAVDPASGAALGEAHLRRDPYDRGVAEVSFAVVDDCQNVHLGTRLAAQLAARARELGISRLRASMLVENTRSRALFRGMGRVVGRSYDGGAVELEVALD
ncbi:MAG: GNAT family N-acetyltransferase [Gaiellaceae bacterium]